MIRRGVFLILILAAYRPWAQGSATVPAGQNINVSEISVFGSTLFATGFSGIWRSEDRGGSWKCVAPGYACSSPVLLGSRLYALSDYAFSPLRLFSSSDGGATWSILPPLDTSDTHLRLRGVRVDAFDGNLLLVGYGGFRSPDSGRTWLNWNIGMEASAHVGPYLLAFTGQRTLRYREGKGFDHPDTMGQYKVEPQGKSDSFATQIVKTYGRFLFADLGGLYRSPDSGTTWNRVLDPSPDCVDSCSRQIAHFAFGPGGGYATVNSQLYRSSDSGATWTRAGAMDNSWALTPLGGDTLLAIASGSIVRSIDGGAHFQPSTVTATLHPRFGPGSNKAASHAGPWCAVSGGKVVFASPAANGSQPDLRDLKGTNATLPRFVPGRR